MKTRIENTEDYIAQSTKWKEELIFLFDILKSTILVEKIKWGIPVFCLKNKNVVGLIKLKDSVGIWFFQGVFLKDEHNLLLNAQEGKTKGMRSLKIKNLTDVSESIIKEYILEAIENQKAGKEIKIERNKKVVVPNYFRDFLKKNDVEQNFEDMSLSCRREYVEYIDSAKKEETKERRMIKSLEMIKESIGLNDKYRKR